MQPQDSQQHHRDDGFDAVRGILVAGVISVFFYAALIAALFAWGLPW